MAKKKKKGKSPPQTSVEQRKKALTQLDQQTYAAALSKLILSDINKKTNRTYTQYTKEKYRQYIENPSSYEKELRNMSNFLYRVSMPYRRFINYLSDIPLFYWNLMPQIDEDGVKSADQLLKKYYKLLGQLENLSMPHEFRQILTTCIREGVYYGFKYEDKNATFFHKLDPDYCRIVEKEAGCYNFAFDFSYFQKYPTYLEYMDPYFTTLYNLYQQDRTNYQWQILDGDKTICIKVDPDTVDPCLPLLVGLFESLLDLIDARSLQRNKDEIQNYKLIALKLPLFDSTKEVDDFSVDITTAKRFYTQLLDVVPASVGVAMTPMDIMPIEFEPDETNANLITSSMSDVFDDSGISQLLFNSNKTGSVGLDASLKVDSAMVWKLVECLERWVRRYIAYNSTGSAKYHFDILRVDIFNKKAEVDRELSLANSGVPNKLKLAAANGDNPYHTLSAQIFENEILGLHEKWIPLQTSYTLSGGSDDEGEVNDETERNKDHLGNQDEVVQ